MLFTVATTLDLTPPGSISSLEVVAATADVRPLRALSVSASSELSEGWAPVLATDLSTETSWVSAPRELQGEEWLALTLPENSSVERAAFAIDAEFIDVFPASWRIDASQDGTQWSTLVSGTSDGIEAGNYYEFGFPAQPATLVRMVAESAGVRDGKVFTALSEFEVERPRPISAEVVLSFSPPGDDGLTGGLNELEFFWSTSRLLLDGEDVVTADGANVTASQKNGPFFPGSLVLHRLSGLPGEETIYIGVRGRDDAGLVGELATAEVVTVPVPPAPVVIESITQTEQLISLQFSASGDDALSGDADHYLMTFNQGVVDLVTNTSADWEWQLQANVLDDASLTANLATNIMPNGRYLVQIVAVDEAGHRSFPSNAVLVQVGAEEDLVAPACVSGLEGILASETGTLASIATIELSPDGETYTALGSIDTLALTDQDPSTVYSYAQEAEALWMRINLANETRLDKAVLDHIPGFEAYLATIQSATCDQSTGPAELQALEPTLTESGVELTPTTPGMQCATLTLQLELPRLAEYNVLGLADLQVMRAPYPPAL